MEAPTSKVSGYGFKVFNSSLDGIPTYTYNQLFAVVRAGLINHCDRLWDEPIPSVLISLRRGYPAEAALHPIIGQRSQLRKTNRKVYIIV